MENLIKSILEQLNILADKQSPQELMKTAPNGQWKLLSKAVVDDGGPAPEMPKAPDYTASNKKFAELFGNLNSQIKAAKARKTSFVNGARGAIKSYALSLPKGQIDLGNLGKLREAHDRLAPPDNPRAARKPFTHNDMAEIVNHHVGDAPSLKHIHDNNGGEHAIGTLARTMGANGEPQEYSAFKFKNPQVHADLIDLVNPGKPHTYDDNVKPLPSTYKDTPNDPTLDEQVNAAHENLMTEQPNGEQGYDDPKIRKHLTNTAATRAIDRFKRHHGIK